MSRNRHEPKPEDRKAMINTAIDDMRKALKSPADLVIFDVETTALKGYACQMSAINGNGEIIGSMLLNPLVIIPPEAVNVHGITNEDVAGKPTFAEVYPRVKEKFAGKTWVAYNINYDFGILQRECRRLSLPMPKPKAKYCAMEAYAVIHGDWNSWHGNYKWQKLAIACKTMNVDVAGLKAHDALSDVHMTLRLMKAVAKMEKYDLLATGNS